jgi:uncharacterized protein YdaU (DUF1376 family)
MAPQTTEKTRPLPWWPRDFAADEHVALMSLEAEGAYRRLLDHQWLHGSIPSDLPTLGKLCKGTPAAKMRRLWVEIAPCFVAAGEGRLVNGRLERVRNEQESYREQKSAAGRASAERRANERATKLHRDAQQNANELSTEGATKGQPPTPSPTPRTNQGSKTPTVFPSDASGAEGETAWSRHAVDLARAVPLGYDPGRYLGILKRFVERDGPDVALAHWREYLAVGRHFADDGTFLEGERPITCLRPERFRDSYVEWAPSTRPAEVPS